MATRTPGYTPVEMMICTAATYLENNALVVVGTGAPCAAAMLAQKTTAPQLMLMFEAGGIGPQLPRMPISVGDSRTNFNFVFTFAIFRKALAQGVVRVDGEVHFGGVRQGFEFWPYLFVRRAEHAKVLIDLIDFSSPGE